MSQAFYTSIGGISVAQTQLNVVADNLANMNTVGFKSSAVTFSDVYYNTISSGNAPTSTTAGTNPKQVGLGVQISAISKDFKNGSLTATGNNTDLYINGDGFFCVTDNTGEIFYTRAGNFSLDTDGNLVLPSGFKAIGADRLYDTKTEGSAIKIPSSIDTETVPNTSTTTGESLNTKLLTKLNGASITEGTFNMIVTHAGGDETLTVDITGAKTLGEIANKIQEQLNSKDFNMKVKCDENTKGTLRIEPVTDPSKTDVLNIEFRSGTSNFVSETRIGSVGGNTYSTDILDSRQIINPVDDASSATAQNYKEISIGSNGAIVLTYSNGDKLTVEPDYESNKSVFVYTTATGTIIKGNDVEVNPNVAVESNLMLQMANFMNPNGLLAEGSNVYSIGTNSGYVTYGTPAYKSFGEIIAGNYEGSNVDMTKEFASMITAQRTIEANSRVFSTANEVMKSLVYMGQ